MQGQGTLRGPLDQRRRRPRAHYYKRGLGHAIKGAHCYEHMSRASNILPQRTGQPMKVKGVA